MRWVCLGRTAVDKAEALAMEIKTSLDGCPIEQDTYNFGMLRMFENFIATASPEIRGEIQKSVEKAISAEESTVYTKPWVDWSVAADLGHKWHGWGNHLLYVWLNKSGIPFYVGQAKDKSRPGDFEYKTRSDEFQAVIREGGCHSVVVAKHIPKTTIDDLEKGLISYFCWKRYPLVNKRDLPSAMECNMAEKIAKAEKKTLEEVFLSETEYRSEFKLIFPVLSAVVGAPWDGETAEFKPKSVPSAEKFLWNGQEKTYLEWSREPGVTVTGSTIRTRLEKGWTMSEALYTPSFSKMEGASMEERRTLYDSYRAQARARGEREMTA